jgi:hypothetical protein
MKLLSEEYWFISSLCSIVLKSDPQCVLYVGDEAEQKAGRTHGPFDDVIIIFDFAPVNRLQESPCLWVSLKVRKEALHEVVFYAPPRCLNIAASILSAA